MKSMTEIAHDFLRPVVKRGAKCLDATLGQGHDTAFFLQEGASRVAALDIQENLVSQAAERYADRRLQAFCHSHALMDQLPFYEEWKGNTDAVIFNFGWDPGLGGGLTTRAESSLQAVLLALALLRPKGRMVLAFYPHEEGQREKRIILDALSGLEAKRSQGLSMMKVERMPERGPSLLLIEKTSKMM